MMSQALTSSEWIEAIERHYLTEYLSAGGSSVKFSVCYSGVDPDTTASKLRARAEGRGFLVADIDSAQTRVHMIEQVFGRIADQIPWDVIIDRILLRLALECQWTIPDSLTSEGVVEQIASLNELDPQQVRLVLDRHVGQRLLLNRHLAKDFRVGMYWLALARLNSPLKATSTYQHVTDWLGGRIRLIGDLKQYQIFSKVVRVNARHMLGSLLAIIREAGYPGVVVTMNGFRLLDSQRPNDGSVYYTKAALFDAYEVFREFVDSTDALDGLFLSVFVPPDFLDIENLRGRGLAIYPALMFRAYDELRSQKHVNPLTAMTRISYVPEISK